MLVLGKRLLLERTNRRRCIGVVLFLTVFFLPLHFHAVATTSQVTKECSCLHGNRTQMGAAATPSDCVAVFTAQPLVMVRHKEVSQRLAIRQSSRAPPPQVSL